MWLISQYGLSRRWVGGGYTGLDGVGMGVVPGGTDGGVMTLCCECRWERRCGWWETGN